MRALRPDQLVPLIEGAVGIRATGDAVQPIRLPVEDLELHHPQLRDPFTGTAACGIRLRFATTSRRVELDVTHDVSTWVPLPAVYDLVVDGALTDRVTAAGPSVSFDDLPAGEKLVEVWLPTGVGVLLRALRVEDDARVGRVPDPSPRWVVYGSSITQGAVVPGTDAPGPTGTWPAVAARRLGWHVTNLGYSASCHLDPYVARAIATLPAARITLKLGMNVHNLQTLRERTFAPLVHGFLQTIRDARPATPITVISPTFSPDAEQSPVSIRPTLPEPLTGDLSLEQMRAILAEVVDVRRRRGDIALDYLDGRELLGPSDVDHLPDGLHPDAEGLTRMGERFAARVFATGGSGAA